MNIINKIKSNLFEIVLLASVFVLLNYIFLIDYYNLSLIFGSFLCYYFLYRLSNHNIRNNIVLILTITFISYFFYGKPISIMAILLGLNLAVVFIQARNLDIKTIDLTLVNSIGLAGILLYSGIEKFRGVNKLNLVDVQATVPVLVLITFFLFLITAYLSQYWGIFKAKFQNKFIYLNYLIAAISGGILISIYYRESGPELILLPYLAGLAVGIIKIAIRHKSILNEVLEIIMLIMFPYQVAGFMGIGIALMTMYLGEYFLNLKTSRITTQYQLEIAKYAPLLFLFASQEIRENEGLINRLDITNGYQMGWLFISLIIVRFAAQNISSFKRIIIKNEIYKMFPQIVIICVLLVFAIIIRGGRFEGTTAIVTACSAYMFILASSESRSAKPIMRFISSVSGLIGAMSFLVLTTF